MWRGFSRKGAGGSSNSVTENAPWFANVFCCQIEIPVEAVDHQDRKLGSTAGGC